MNAALLLLLAAAPRVTVPTGEYVPFLNEPGSVPVAVAPFELDARPVTQEELLAFVRANPSWRRSAVARVFADDGYLRSWAGDGAVQPGGALAPVTDVSWFAARAYCRWRGGDLPTTAQWEHAAQGGNPEEILAWYGAPTPAVLPNAGSGAPNRFGARDLHALIWEWVLDFNATMVTGEGRGGDGLFCGGGAAKAVKPSDYARFMREAFRGSLEARYTVRNLGFRCAGSGKPVMAPRADVGRHGSESLYNLKATWRDASGRRVSLSSLEGSVVVLAMIYTSCMGICPMTVTDMKRIESALPDADRRKVRFVLVSFDPKRDAPETLDAYATTRALPKEAWTLLTGDEDGVRELAAAVGMRLKPTPSGDFVHSTVISVLDEKGVVAAQQKGLGEDPAPTVATLRKLLER